MYLGEGDVKLPDNSQKDYISSAPKDVQVQFNKNGTKDENQTHDLNSKKHDSKNENIPPYVAECFFFYNTTSSEYYYPPWMRPENLLDKNKRRPSDPEYDQTSLWVPDQAGIEAKAKAAKKAGKPDTSDVIRNGKLFSPMFAQYWTVKQDNFDSVVMFKVGKFYEIFFYDAAIANRVCDLQWMRQKLEPHVG